ncbi:hypothetical protein OF83DRAFT_424077 [Amylostereum chailletii]|nr:hypothetical protein OF83DRAFT_424077 [Amylostereum chailletii]
MQLAVPKRAVLCRSSWIKYGGRLPTATIPQQPTFFTCRRIPGGKMSARDAEEGQYRDPQSSMVNSIPLVEAIAARRLVSPERRPPLPRNNTCSPTCTSQRWNAYILAHLPLPHLPPHLLPQPHDTRAPPLLHYGIFVTERQIVTCARRTGLVGPNRLGRTELVSAFPKVLAYLKRKTGVRLSLARPLWAEHADMQIVAVCSNMNVGTEGEVGEERKRAVGVIKDEMESESEALWWWDWENGPDFNGEHECPLS